MMSLFKKSLIVFSFLIVTFASQANTDLASLKARYFDAAREGNQAMLEAFYDAGLDANVADEKATRPLF